MRKILLTLLTLFISIVVYSQNENPFKEFGYDVLVATSSKGEFEEFHDQTDVVEIGSVLFNTRTNEIVKVLEKDETTIDISSATAAMSIDPHCERYYWISPYVYCANNPIKFIDPDGRDWVMRGVGGTAYYYYDKDVKSWDDIKTKYHDGGIKGNISLISEGQQVGIKDKDGNVTSYTFSNENKSFTSADGTSLGAMDIMQGKGFAVIGTGDKNVDGASLHNNYFGTSTTGPNNPMTNDGLNEYFGYLPFQSNQDSYSTAHDIGYMKKGANGAVDAFLNPNVLKEDAQLSKSNMKNSLNPTISERERWKSIGTGVAFGGITLFKTASYPLLKGYNKMKK